MMEVGVCEADLAVREAAERVIAEGVRCVAAELRLIDLGALLPQIVNHRHGNLEDIVNSAAELFFMPGALRFNRSSGVSMGWGQCPELCLGLVLAHDELRAAFELVIASSSAHVRLGTVCTGLDGRPGGSLSMMLQRALDAVRLELPTAMVAELHASALRPNEVSLA